MSRYLRDPRVRVLLAVGVLALMLLLSWHLIAMGIPGMAMMLGLCIAVLAAAAALLLPPAWIAVLASTAAWGPAGRPRRARVEPLGRHPPDDGIRLRS